MQAATKNEMSIKNVEWSQKLYNVKEIMATVTLPALTRVETAYFGEKNLETFSAGQVLWINDIRQQQCMIAEDKVGNHISIPMDSPVRFHMLDKPTEEETKTLNELVLQYDLPIQVKFNMEDITTLILDGASRQASWYQELTLTSRHDLTYLLAVCISKDMILPDVQCLPVYLKEEFSIGLNLCNSETGCKATDWSNFKKYLKDLVDQKVDFWNYSENSEIIIYPADEVKNLKKSSSAYESLIPHRLGSEYEQLQLDSSSNEKSLNSQMKKQKKINSKAASRQKKSSEVKLKTSTSVDNIKRPAEKPKKHKQIFTTQERSFYQEIDYETTLPPPVPTREPKQSTTIASKLVRHSSLNDSHKAQQEGNGDQANSSNLNKHGPIKTPLVASITSARTLTRPSSLIIDTKTLQTNKYRPIHTAEDIPATTVTRHSSLVNSQKVLQQEGTAMEANLTHTNKSGSIKTLETKPAIPKKPTKASKNMYTNPRTGTVTDANPPQMNKSGLIQALEAKPAISSKPTKSSENMYTNPRAMSVSEVEECLRLLHMDKYVDTFRRNSVDGELLCDMDNDILVEDLGMSKLHALKLRKFVAGQWIPESLSVKP